MEPQETYKLIVEVEGDEVYRTEAYSVEDLELHLGDAEQAVDRYKNGLLELHVGNDYAI